MARPTLPTTYAKGQGAHRDDHTDLATIANDAMLASENFGSDSAPADLPTARTNLGLGSSSTSDLASTTPAATATSGTVGVGTTVARDDHVHASPQLTASTPAATSTSAAVGVATTSARADHVHVSPQLSSGTPVALGSAAAGSGTASSKDDHVHPTTGLLLTTNLSSTTPAATAASGTVGVGTTVARADHVHASPQLSTNTPVALGSAAAGSGTASSKDDHIHPTTGLLLTTALSSATPSALASAGSAGSSSNVSKADHAHGLAAAWADYTPTLTNITIGNGTVAARYALITPNLMAVYLVITLGSTSSVTGAIGVSLPGGVTGETTVAQRVVSSCYDSSADTIYAGAAAVTSSAMNAIRTHGIAATATTTVPFTWATSDNLRLWGVIELT